MNIKKILLLSIILVAVLAICVSPGFAVTKTTGKLYFDTKKGNEVVKKIGSEFQDKINLQYNAELPLDTKVQTYMYIGHRYNGPETKYQMISAKVVFRKKLGTKTYYSTKTFKAKDNGVEYNAKNGYKPYYAIVKYTDTEKTGKIKFNTQNDGASVSKKIGYWRKLQLSYNKASVDSNSGKIQTHIIIKQGSTSDYEKTIIKLEKAKVTFIKKVGSKNYYSTKTLKPTNGRITYNAKNGYKPYSAVVTYKWVYSKVNKK